MRRLVLLGMLSASLLAFQATLPEASSSWGCGTHPPQCVYGGSNSQCDSICGVGFGQCVRPGCCACLAF
jgi:hypothetical protein